MTPSFKVVVRVCLPRSTVSERDAPTARSTFSWRVSEFTGRCLVKSSKSTLKSALKCRMAQERLRKLTAKVVCGELSVCRVVWPYPLAVVLLHVEVVCGEHALLHAPTVPGDPTLDGLVSGGRAQRKLLQVLHRDGRRRLGKGIRRSGA